MKSTLSWIPFFTASHSARERSGPSPMMQQPRGNFLLHAVEDFDHVFQPLHRPEVRQVHQDFFVRLRIVAARLQQFRRAVVDVAVHEVGNHLDRGLHLEDFHRALLQVVGDGSNAVALLNGKARDRKVGGIGADQRDVGSVQRGDVRQPARLAHMVAAQHLPGQHGAHRMRNGVVHVQQIEIVNLRHLGHARRQRQIVGRIFEQRILRHFDLVKVNVGLRLRAGELAANRR